MCVSAQALFRPNPTQTARLVSIRALGEGLGLHSAMCMPARGIRIGAGPQIGAIGACDLQLTSHGTTSPDVHVILHKPRSALACGSRCSAALSLATLGAQPITHLPVVVSTARHVSVAKPLQPCNHPVCKTGGGGCPCSVVLMPVCILKRSELAIFGSAMCLRICTQTHLSPFHSSERMTVFGYQPPNVQPYQRPQLHKETENDSKSTRR